MSSAPGIAVPGTTVPVSSLVSSGGAQGIQGIQGDTPWTTTTADFTMPAAGSTVVVSVQDASWVIIGSMVSVQTAGGSPTQAASLRVQSKSGNQLTLLYQPPSAMPLASTTQAGLLAQVSGNPGDYVGGDNSCHTLGRLQFFSAAYNLTASDNNKFVVCSGGSWVLGLPAPVIGLVYRVRNDMGISGTTGTITITPASGTIDGLASLALLPGQECAVYTDGTNWRSFGRQREVVIGTQDITASTASATILLPAGYRYFLLDFTALLTSIDNTNLNAVVSTNGGSTWITSANYWSNFIYNANPTTLGTSQNASQAQWQILGIAGNTPGAQAQVTIYPGSASQRPSFIGWANSYSSVSGGIQTSSAMGFLAVNGLINALKYSVPSANITNSFLTVKGVV